MLVEHKKADFKARREMLGLSQSLLADVCDVTTTSVKRWERPGFPEPPEDAWDYIEECEERQQKIVAFAVDKAEELARETGAQEVFLTYFRSQEEYDKHGRDPGSCMMANANVRRIAAILAHQGYDVSFVYPEDWPTERPMNDS